MTEAQLLKFYLPAWHRCWAALWTKSGRNIVAREGRTESALLEQVENVGCALSRQAGAKFLRQEDLRRAVSLVATGKESSQKMNNGEINRAVALMHLLANPDDLAASMKYDHPEIAERAAYEAQLRDQPPAYVEAICVNRFGTRNWLGLEFEQLRQLAMTVRHRQPRSPAVRGLPATKSIGRGTQHAPV